MFRFFVHSQLRTCTQRAILSAIGRRPFLSGQIRGFPHHGSLWRDSDAVHSAIQLRVFPWIVSNLHDGVRLGTTKRDFPHELLGTVQFSSAVAALGACPSNPCAPAWYASVCHAWQYTKRRMWIVWSQIFNGILSPMIMHSLSSECRMSAYNCVCIYM